MKMSKQLMKGIMIAFQIAISEQKDIQEIFEEFELEDSDDGIVVLNPPIYKIKETVETKGE